MELTHGLAMAMGSQWKKTTAKSGKRKLKSSMKRSAIM